MFQIYPDAVMAEELMPHNPAELKAEQCTRRVQIQHDHRKVHILNRIELQIDAWQQERIAIPA